MKLKISKGDKVEVIAGSSKGSQGAVIALDKNGLRVKIQGIRMQTHFSKEDGQSQKEGFIDYSNVKLVEKAQKKAKKKSLPHSHS